MLVASSVGLCKPCVLWLTTDDEEDLDVLDPAQLASAHASQQQPQQHQQHQEQQQQPQLYIHCQERHSCRQYCTRQAPNKLQSGAISKEMQFPDWQLLDEPSGWLDEQQEEKLIRMDDPLFSSLSERRQKLMALEEILLNTGIEG